jgi:hypothetical protein
MRARHLSIIPFLYSNICFSYHQLYEQAERPLARGRSSIAIVIVYQTVILALRSTLSCET